MMIQRRHVLLSLLGSIVLSARMSRVNAEQLLDAEALAAHLASNGNLEGRFTQSRTLAGFPKPVVTEGRFVFAPAKGVLWATEKPFPSEIVLSSDRFSTTNAFGSETLSTKDLPQLEAVNRLVMEVASGRFDVLEDAFTTKIGGTLEAWTIELTPRDGFAGRIFKRVVAKGGLYPEAIILETTDGQRTDVTLSEQKPAASLPASLH